MMANAGPPGKRGIAKGFCVAVNGSIALTFPFARGNRRAAREVVSSLHAVGWRTLYRQGYRVVPVVIREIKQGRPRPEGKGE